MARTLSFCLWSLLLWCWAVRRHQQGDVNELLQIGKGNIHTNNQKVKRKTDKIKRVHGALTANMHTICAHSAHFDHNYNFAVAIASCMERGAIVVSQEPMPITHCMHKCSCNFAFKLLEVASDRDRSETQTRIGRI